MYWFVSNPNTSGNEKKCREKQKILENAEDEKENENPLNKPVEKPKKKDVDDEKEKENPLDKPAERTKKKRKLLSKVRMCSSFWFLLFVTFTEKTGQHT